MKTIKEKIAVMHAADCGCAIELIGKPGSNSALRQWRLVDENQKIAWNWDAYDYRVVLPKPFEAWVNVYSNDPTLYCYPSRERANEKQRECRLRCIHVREVIE
jgi:hypothetical protein